MASSCRLLWGLYHIMYKIYKIKQLEGFYTAKHKGAAPAMAWPVAGTSNTLKAFRLKRRPYAVMRPRAADH